MKAILRTAAILFVLTVMVHGAEPSAEAQAESVKLLGAMESDNYDAFIADGNEAFKGLKKETFDAAVAQLLPRFRSGYDVTYFGEMKVQGCQVTIWKLSFKDGGDDALATLSLKDGKVAGYWIR